MLQLQDIAWSAPDGDRILKGVSLTVPDDTLMVITGPNGGGKTTLAKLIAGHGKARRAGAYCSTARTSPT